MLTFRQKGRVMPYTNPSSSVAIASSSVVVITAGVRGCIGVATDTIAPSAPGELSVEGVHELAANSGSSYGETGVQNQAIYWDAVNFWLTVTYNSNCTLAGSLFLPKNSGDQTAWVKLRGLYAPSGLQAAAPTYASLTDNSGGTAIAPVSGVGTLPAIVTQTVTIPVNLSELTAATTLNIDPGFNGKIAAINFRVGAKPASTASKAATLTVGVAGTPATGGVVALTTAACNAVGAQVAGSAITAGNSFTASQAVDVAISAVTAFVEGDGFIELTLINTDLLNEISTLTAAINNLTSILTAAGEVI
jgi:hypothetical protein